MKKTILALLLMGSGAAVWAQNTQSDSTGTTNNTINNTNSSINNNANTSTNRDANLNTNTDVNTSTNNNLNSSMNSNSNSNTNSNLNTNTNTNINSSTNNGVNTNANPTISTDSSNNSSMNSTNNSTMNNPMNNSSNNATMSSTGNYSAYSAATSVPNAIQSSFQQAYPGATGTRWEQSNDFYRVYYQNNGQDMNMYYDARGNSFMMALPVTQSGVTTDVISKIKGMYGTNVYDITPIKVADHSDAYNVRIIENGQIRSEVVDAQGQTITQIYRTPESDSIWAANERMKRMQAADSAARANWNNANMSTDQSTTTDSTSTNMNSNNMNTNSSNAANSSLSTESGSSSNTNSGNNNSDANSTQTNDQSATKTEEPQMKSDSTIKKDE